MSDEKSNAPAPAPEFAQSPAAAKEDAPIAPTKEHTASAESKPAAEPVAANASAPAAIEDSGKSAEGMEPPPPQFCHSPLLVYGPKG